MGVSDRNFENDNDCAEYSFELDYESIRAWRDKEKRRVKELASKKEAAEKKISGLQEKIQEQEKAGNNESSAELKSELKKEEEKLEKTKKKIEESASKGQAILDDVHKAIGISKRAYGDMENGKGNPFNSFPAFFKLADYFGVDPIDLVSDNCGLKSRFSSVQIKDLKNSDEFNKFLYEKEKKYGRVTVFNTFPSSIYHDEGKYSKLRLDMLTHEPSIKNQEYYPISCLLSFCFNHSFEKQSFFPHEKKIKIVENMIAAFEQGVFDRQIHLFDPSKTKYFYDSPTCTCFEKENTVLIPSPTHIYTIVIIRSPDIVEDMRKFYFRDGCKMNTMESIFFLKDILNVLKTGQSFREFLSEFIKKTDHYAKFVLDSLPINLLESIE